MGSACWLMNTDRSVWFGYTGTLTAVILRTTVFFLPTVVVVFLTTIVTCSSPQRSTWAAVPVNDFVATLTFFFCTVFATDCWEAAHASTLGKASASTLTTTVTDLRIGFVSLDEGEAFGVDVTAGDA